VGHWTRRLDRCIHLGTRRFRNGHDQPYIEQRRAGRLRKLLDNLLRLSWARTWPVAAPDLPSANEPPLAFRKEGRAPAPELTHVAALCGGTTWMRKGCNKR